MAELADAHGLGPCPFWVWVQLPPAAIEAIKNVEYKIKNLGENL